MTKLKTDISEVLRQLKRTLAEATWQSRRRYFNQMLRIAEKININEPCRELYDAFIEDDHGSPERRSMHLRCVKLLDAVAGTGATDKTGVPYNEKPLPGEAEAAEFFENRSFPVPDNVVRIDCLIVKADMEIRHIGHSESTIWQYRQAWRYIHKYAAQRNSEYYNELLIDEYIQEINVRRSEGSLNEWKWKINRKAALVLLEVARTGHFRWKISRGKQVGTSQGIESVRSIYLASLEQRNLSKSTIGLHDYTLRKMISFIGAESLGDLMVLAPEDIARVVIKFAEICSGRSMSAILPIVRIILVYLHERGYTGRNLSGVVMNGSITRGSIAAYLSGEDRERIILQLDKESKRTKAIVMTAMKLGLRDSDISAMRITDIDWRNDKIRFNQKKTGDPIVLPLLPDVGNALADYILHERPKRDDGYPYVFLREQAPHDRIFSVYATCSKLIKKLGIRPINGNRIGTHLLRHSMVHKLLEIRTPHQVITDVLGHTSKESDKPYISMEESMLRMCPLDLSVIGKISWGGGSSNG
jgi:integrase